MKKCVDYTYKTEERVSLDRVVQNCEQNFSVYEHIASESTGVVQGCKR